MTKLQQMVEMDAVRRFIAEQSPRTMPPLKMKDPLTIPTDQEIKEDGYEGAVDNVYQQMVEAVTAE
jgi:hypothetical protein